MTRLLYRWILWMHPPGFRDRFAPELLAIFDEARSKREAWALNADGFVSLARQWLLRSNAWTVVPAMVAASLQFAFIGMMWHLPGGACNKPVGLDAAHGRNEELALFLVLAATVVVLLVGAVSLWSRSWMKRRDRTLREPMRACRLPRTRLTSP